MKLLVYAYKNKQISCFTNPFFVDVEPDKMAVNVTRQAKLEKDKGKISHLGFYHLGDFDDCSGKFDILTEPLLLVDLDDVIGGDLDVSNKN